MYVLGNILKIKLIINKVKGYIYIMLNLSVKIDKNMKYF